MVLFEVKNSMRPQILVSEKDYLVVYKPPRMHTAPLAHSSSDNLLGWCAGKYPQIAGIPGRRAGEGGLLHRLDFETHGLLLISRTQQAMEALIEHQKNGTMIKEYSALASAGKTTLKGFPMEKPEIPPGKDNAPASFPVKSAFRAYGIGRKAVRPVIACENNARSKDAVFDGVNPYITEILKTQVILNGITSFQLRIVRGFRHQIRSHLAWLNMPILNDSIYGGAPYGKGLLGLRAYSLSFIDPSSGLERAYAIRPLELDEI